MSSCPRATRRRARNTAEALDACDAVRNTLVLDPNQGPWSEWTIEVTISGGRLPAEAVQVLAEHDCAVLSTTMRAPGSTQAVIAL